MFCSNCGKSIRPEDAAAFVDQIAVAVMKRIEFCDDACDRHKSPAYWAFSTWDL